MQEEHNSTWVFVTYGEGVDKDKAVAVEWYQKAAEQGYARAQFSLGVCYAYGEGVDEDHAVAVEWYQKAAGKEYASTDATKA